MFGSREHSERGEHRITLTLASSLASVDQVEQTAEHLAAEAGIDEDARFGITMAVREAAANAVFHGNKGNSAKHITASFENTGTSLIFCIADEGEGLDPDTLPDPLAPENLMRGSGRGIFLIRSFMDEVHFRRLEPGTEMTLIKRFTPEANTGTNTGNQETKR
ncbi:ATP-binding protein [Acidipila sp. EB88]|uniref:ATP-binding protein n=1 Tax=Acidipila sp. EB88 TaxID=2305226 RepID=UPI000F5E4CA8|nr:ATP-binding protein [Acidipila sp. EB88]RRA49203.1 ATP-binding protein [Acidipila sp. EB88]